jgi:hypothetical protein
VLEHHPLSGLHAIEPSLEHAGHHDEWRVRSGVIHASIAIVAHPHAYIRRIRPADHDAKIRREQRVSVALTGGAGRKAHLDSAVIERDQQGRNLARRERLNPPRVSPCYISRKLRIIWWPPSVSTLSGWNCTPSMGRRRAVAQAHDHRARRPQPN